MEWEQVTGISGSVAVVGALGRLIWYVESEVIRSLRERVDEIEDQLKEERDAHKGSQAEHKARVAQLEEELRAAQGEAYEWRRRHNRLDDLRRGIPPAEDMRGPSDRT